MEFGKINLEKMEIDNFLLEVNFKISSHVINFTPKNSIVFKVLGYDLTNLGSSDRLNNRIGSM